MASYPSPNAQAVMSNAGPFYGSASQPPQIPQDLPQLQDHHTVTITNEDSTSGNPSNTSMYHPAVSNLASELQRDPHQTQHPRDDLDLRASLAPPQAVSTSSGRKRQKVSRACDACRQKKIKCDAALVNPNEACTTCKKLNLPFCEFSREPMKRGPSKGYIKELEDRLSELESQRNPRARQEQYTTSNYALVDNGSYEMEQGDFESDRHGSGMVKRKISASALEPHTRSSFASEPRPQRAALEETLPFESYGSAGSRPQDALVALASERPTSTSGSQQRTNDDTRPTTQLAEQTGIPSLDPKVSIEIAFSNSDEAALDDYYHVLHQTFPILSHTKSGVRARLSECSTSCRTAFMACLTAFIQTQTSSSPQLPQLPNPGSTLKSAIDLISTLQPPSTLSCALVHVQCLILLILTTSRNILARVSDRPQLLPTTYLTRAIKLATEHDLSNPTLRSDPSATDPDSNAHLSSRLYWTLFILDCFHAASTASPPQFPKDIAELQLDDQIRLGESTYHLARCAHILGHVAEILQQPAELMSTSSPASAIISTVLMGELDRFRESVESVLLGAPNLLCLCYWHTRQLILRLTTTIKTRELLACTAKVIDILRSEYFTVTPLDYHFTALAAVILKECAKVEELRHEYSGTGLGLSYLVTREHDVNFKIAMKVYMDTIWKRGPQGVAADTVDAIRRGYLTEIMENGPD